MVNQWWVMGAGFTYRLGVANCGHAINIDWAAARATRIWDARGLKWIYFVHCIYIIYTIQRHTSENTQPTIPIRGIKSNSNSQCQEATLLMACLCSLIVFLYIVYIYFKICKYSTESKQKCSFTRHHSDCTKKGQHNRASGTMNID